VIQAGESLPPGLLTWTADVDHEHGVPAAVREDISVQCFSVESAHRPGCQAVAATGENKVACLQRGVEPSFTYPPFVVVLEDVFLLGPVRQDRRDVLVESRIPGKYGNCRRTRDLRLVPLIHVADQSLPGFA
jgi:hypothetical protein